MRYARLDALDADVEHVRGTEVVVVGAGATGSRMLEQLARMGADLTIIDRDFLEPSNLGTSALYTRRQVEQGLPKAVAAARQLRNINPDIRIRSEVADLNPRTADRLLGDADIILDGTDNMETRFLINDYCASHLVPWVHVSALATSGEVMGIVPAQTACFNCVFNGVDSSSLDTCETTGILPGAAATAASLGVSEALKLLHGRPLGELVRFDLAGSRFSRLDVEQREGCEVCAGKTFPYLNGEAGSSTTAVCGENTYQVDTGEELVLEELAATLSDTGDVELNPYLLRFSGPAEFTVFPDGRMIVEADSPERARSIYARYVGN